MPPRCVHVRHKDKDSWDDESTPRFRRQTSDASSELEGQWRQLQVRLSAEESTPKDRERDIRAHLELMRTHEALLAHRLEKVKERYAFRREATVRQADVHHQKVEACKEKLDQLMQSRNPAFVPPPDPPGPASLRFVEGNLFMCIASLIIVANIVTMVLEMLDRAYAQRFFWVDQFFMLFYIAELTMKAILMHRTLLIGEFRVVWWNWLDAVIVFTGVLDMYLKPLLIDFGLVHEGSHGPSVLSFLRMLRLARLARILKIVNVFLKSDLSWTESDQFQAFIMSVIGFNSVLMGFEADLPNFAGWFYIEQVLLTIFTFELLVRLKYNGCSFFCSAGVVWNWLDFIVVVGGIVDQWMMPLIALVQELAGQEPSTPHGMGHIMTLLRMARLLRILRLARLVKNIPPLYKLAVGIVHAFQGMTWVMILTFVVLYSFSLLAVLLIGHGLVFTGAVPKEAKVFSSLMESFFILFKIMNSDLGDIQPLLKVFPPMKAATAGFMVLTTWSILSILTAVVSENMISASEEAREEYGDDAKARRVVRSTMKLGEIFDWIVQEFNESPGTISFDTFQKVLDDTDLVDELLDATDLDEGSLRDLGPIMSQPMPNGDLVIERERFVLSLQEYSDSLTERSFMALECRLAALEHFFHRRLRLKLKQREIRLRRAGPGSQASCQPASDAVPRPLAPSQRTHVRLRESVVC